MNKKASFLCMLSVIFLAVSCKSPDLNNISNDNSIFQKKSKISLSGKVDFSVNLKENKSNSFKIKATENDIISKANVTLTYPLDYFDINLRNNIIGSGIANENGNFFMTLTDSFAPIVGQIYFLDSSKRKNGQGSDNISLRTIVIWNGNSFDSISTPNIVINSKTTALSILASYSAVIPQDTIGKVNILEGISSLPTNITDSTTTPETNLTSETINNTLSMVEDSLIRNVDPLASILLKNGQLFFSQSGDSKNVLFGCVNNCVNVPKITPVTKNIPLGSETRPIDASFCLGDSVFCSNKEDITLSVNKTSPSLITGIVKQFNGSVSVKLNDVAMNPYEYVYDRSSNSIKVLKNLNSGDKITITGKTDPIGYNYGFPNLINQNIIPYGFYFDFSEITGNTVYDKSGNNNNGSFFKLGNDYPERKTGIFNSSSVSFKSNSSIKVTDSPTIETNDSFTYLFVFTPDVINTNQMLAVKNISDSGDVAGTTRADTSFAFFITEENKLLCWLYSGYNVVSISDPLDLTLGKPVGLAISLDRTNKILKIVKNQTEMPFVLDTTSQPRFIDINDFQGLQDIDADLHIGNHIYYHNTLSVDYPFLGRMHRVANTTQALTVEQIKTIFANLNLKN
ncbi:MAG: hypothetical protein AABZ74_17450 [Cyanobacteriota bacterium]